MGTLRDKPNESFVIFCCCCVFYRQIEYRIARKLSILKSTTLLLLDFKLRAFSQPDGWTDDLDCHAHLNGHARLFPQLPRSGTSWS